MSWHLLQAEDIIDDIIQYQTSSLSSSYKLDPSYGDFQIKEEPLHLTDQEKKERVKKDNHNQSKFRIHLECIWFRGFQLMLFSGGLRDEIVDLCSDYRNRLLENVNKL